MNNTADSLQDHMLRFQAQDVLFAPQPRRLALQGLEANPVKPRRSSQVNVWRNHAFESVAALAVPYMAFAGWQIAFNLSDYDDALMFADVPKADAELLWLDSDRYLSKLGFDEWLVWLEARLKVLRGQSIAPIVLATWVHEEAQAAALSALVERIPATHFANLAAECRLFDVKLLDPRSAAMSGTPIAGVAQPVLARALVGHWLAAAILPPVKALALDLDHTLHQGVLGEDGVLGVVLTDAHRHLHQFARDLSSRGVFLALVSRNEMQDVEQLFAARDDYPLRWDDFSAREVSWGSKADAVLNISKTLRIAPDAVLFIDDNPGELASVAMALPQVFTVYASPDAEMTQRAIDYFPGLWRWKIEADDSKRVLDLKANAERAALLEGNIDTADYFRSLQVSLVYRYDPIDQLSRLADLCNKTNQFNMAMRRLNQVEVADRLHRDDACVVSVQMKDRLSDSGVIAVIVACRTGTQLQIEELCVSCRAMGRRLEDSIIINAIRNMPQFAGCDEVAFRVEHGPRNQPALSWLSGWLGQTEVPQPGLHLCPAVRLQQFEPAQGVSIIRD